MAPTICLNMIVKNESKIITRLLQSVLPVIDTFCICDTGSTDNTKEIIEKFFEKHNILGKVIFKEFVNFGYNRTYALEQAKDMADYLLFLDADMILKIGPKFDKNKFTKDVYSIYQGNDNFRYANTRITSTKIGVKVVSPTHEYYDIQNEASKESLDSDILFINDIGDGGSKENKFKRDIELLLKGIEEEPNNVRYYFYLANSYFDTKDYTNAIIYYKKRISLGQWVEEIFYSWYRLGFCYERIMDSENMLMCWLSAYQALPKRAESLYEIIKWYRYRGKNDICKMIYNTAKNIPYPTDCSLFLHKDVYDYKLLEEYTIFGWHTYDRNLSSECFKLMKIKPKNEIYSLFNNYKFYQKILEPINSIKLNDTNPNFDRTFFKEKYSFTASSPSIIPMHYGYMVNLRFVNYKINKNGTYPYYKHITTINKQLLYTKEFKLITLSEVENENLDRRYIGTEDVKLFKKDDSVLYTGTVYFKNEQIGVVIGEYNKTIVEVTTKQQQYCEKNWVFIPHEKDLKMIYNWDPLTIGKIVDNKLVIDTIKEMPQLFSLARGSTNGFLFKNEIWLLVHFVHHNNNEPRHYYHSIVVFDKNMNLLRYSLPIKFSSGEIEYAIGMVVEEDRVIITHSVWDRESYIKIYKKEYIDSLFLL